MLLEFPAFPAVPERDGKLHISAPPLCARSVKSVASRMGTGSLSDLLPCKVSSSPSADGEFP